VDDRLSKIQASGWPISDLDPLSQLKERMIGDERKEHIQWL
jgi:hypothetical protein